jgi:exonuclease V
MKQGTQVHQALEEEVHIIVPVDVVTKEDSWGLRLWNIIQGLKTLQQSGRTRELEVWGTVGGELVNGVIDEISYECPDPGLEQMTAIPKQTDLPEGQVRITDFLASAKQKEGGQSMAAALGGSRQDKEEHEEKRIYITDIKTRQSKSLPSPNAMKPAILQLHLYHHMLENIAQGNLALEKLSERYNFEVDQTFSDSFIAQVGGLNEELFEVPSSQDSMDILLAHNTVASLWKYMTDLFGEIFLLPPPNDEPPTPTPQTLSDLRPERAQPTRLSPILTVEYLSASYQHKRGEATQKHSLGSKSFNFNAEYLKGYLEDSLTWWHGEREAKGVELQEAWKCRMCDFRNDCQWIHDRDRAALQEALERKSLRQEAYKTQPRKSEI